VTGVLAGARFQLWLMRRTIDHVQALVLAPLFAMIFVGLVLAGDRPDLVPVAALGAALVSLWNMAVQVGSHMIDMERRGGTFEQLVSSATPLYALVVGRAAAIIAVALLALPEVWLVTYLVSGVAIAVPHPAEFAVGMVLTALGLHASATLLAVLSVLARNRMVLQNALNYPFYLLGGLFVPVAALPDWLRPFTRVIFLSWGSDLLRATLATAAMSNVGAAVAGLAATVLGTALAGRLVLSLVLRRARIEGTLSYT